MLERTIAKKKLWTLVKAFLDLKTIRCATSINFDHQPSGYV